MKVLFFVLHVIYLTTGFQGSPTVIDSDEIRINGIGFNATREQILKEFGNPIRIFQPNYECGFLSTEEQGAVYYSIKYDFLVFTGNNAEGYLLEEALIAPTLKAKISYKGKGLSHNTTIKEFESIFETKVEGDSVLLFFKGADDALDFTFKNGKLDKIEYWSPC